LAKHLHNARYSKYSGDTSMKKVALMLALLSAPFSWADDAMEKPYISTTETISVTARVEAINHETREVTLLVRDGETVSFVASDEARNLGQVDVGDMVKAKYVQNLTIEVVAGNGEEPVAAEMGAIARTSEGEMPGMAAIGSVMATARVEEINIEANTFKLKNAEGEIREYVARDPRNLERASVGDLVVITMTEAIAIVVEETSAHHEM
jgi:hypothetical protein